MRNNDEHYQDTLAGLWDGSAGEDLDQFHISNIHAVPGLPALQDSGDIDNKHRVTFYIYLFKYLAIRIRVFTR